MIYVAGYLGNANRRATSFTPSQAAHANYPATNLGYGLPSKLFRFNASGADIDIVSDINFLLNQDMETWTVTTLPDDWTQGAGAGSIARSTTQDEGTYAAELTGAIIMYQDVEVLTGKGYEYGVALQGDGTEFAIFRIQDLDTYKWLKTDGTWQVAQTAAATRDTASYADSTDTFTIESPATCQHKTTLRVYCVSTAGSGVYFDDLYLIPTLNMTSIHGHNLPTGATLSLVGATDSAFGTGTDETIGAPTIAQPGFFLSFSTDETYRYWKLVIGSEDNSIPIWIGEWALGHATTLGQTMRYGWSATNRQPQTRVSMSPSGQLYSQMGAYKQSRDLDLDFMATTEANRDEVLVDLLQASEWGDEPVIIIPDTSDEIVIHGRTGRLFDYSNDPGTSWKYKLHIVEDAYPVEGF